MPQHVNFMINKKIIYSKIIVFFIGLFIFSSAAIFGWVKLQYGFNFIDEGYHMTEAWRLAAGDDFLKDKITGAISLHTLINKQIFKIYPNITLLGFRRLEYLLTIFSLLIFGFAIFRTYGQYIYLPYIFSLFAFTGLDPNGMISNLSYQTYPHLFLTLYLSLLLFGLNAKRRLIKKFFYILAGLCLWGISLSLLHLGAIILSPILMFYLFRKLNLKSYSFSFGELLYILSPFLLMWLALIIVFNKPFIRNIIDSIDTALSMRSHSSGLASISWDAIKYLSISISFLFVFFAFTKKRVNTLFLITGCSIISILLIWIIHTSCFGFLPSSEYYKNFNKPMWFSSLVIAFSILFWIYILMKYILKKGFNKEDELSIIFMIPFTICSFSMSIFSTLGLLAASQSSIPAVAAIALIYTGTKKCLKSDYHINALILSLLLGPFYFANAYFDWNFTFFDVSPKYEDTRIENGFGKGIYTNRVYYDIYQWVKANSDQYTQPGDYAIVYVEAPMVHMIIKRRPSLDDSFMPFVKSMSYYEKAIEKMKKQGRYPKIAFVFERMPAFCLASIENDAYTWMPKEFDFSTSLDPVSTYVKNNMTQVSVCKISDDNFFRCFIDNKQYAKYKINTELGTSQSK